MVHWYTYLAEPVKIHIVMTMAKLTCFALNEFYFSFMYQQNYNTIMLSEFDFYVYKMSCLLNLPRFYMGHTLLLLTLPLVTLVYIWGYINVL